jgi:hypothetical protein
MKIRDIQAISFVDNLIIFRAAVHRIGWWREINWTFGIKWARLEMCA